MKKFGIIGGGTIARFHAQAIQAMTNGKLEAIFVRNPDIAKKLGEEFNCTYYSNIDNLLADKNIDIVTIATPSGAHLEPTLKAASTGKHIICEKPLEVTPERVQQMISHCKKNNVLLSGIFNRRFNSAVTHLKQAIQKNRFGKITLCDAQIKWFRDQAYYDSAAWRGTWKLDGGGALMNQSIHTVDQLIYLVGNIKRLSATMACLAHENIEVEDTAVAILEFENGARGAIQGSTACWSSTGHPAQVQICGDEGSVFLTDETFQIWDFKNPMPEDDFVKNHLMAGKVKGLGANDPKAINIIGHQRNFEDVVEALENGREPFVTGAEALRAIEVIDAIYRSAKADGKWIYLNGN